MKIGVLGCNGRVGKQLVKTIYYNNPACLGGCLEAIESPMVGEDIGKLLNVSPIGISITADVGQIMSTCDVAIDFTNNHAATEHAQAAARYAKPIIIGTTGFTDTQEQIIKELSKVIPIVKSANMSLGVNVLFKLVEYAAKVLTQDAYDIDIIEKHHKHKIDAPSGTALTIGHLIAKANNSDLKNLMSPSRKGAMRNARENKKIAFHSIRGGSIVGEHSVLFIGEGEILELKHTSISRDIFIQGTLKAAHWILNQPNGLYSFQEILNKIAKDES